MLCVFQFIKIKSKYWYQGTCNIYGAYKCASLQFYTFVLIKKNKQADLSVRKLRWLQANYKIIKLKVCSLVSNVIPNITEGI